MGARMALDSRGLLLHLYSSCDTFSRGPSFSLLFEKLTVYSISCFMGIMPNLDVPPALLPSPSALP